jgi:hypothetical protein
LSWDHSTKDILTRIRIANGQFRQRMVSHNVSPHDLIIAGSLLQN